MRRITSLVLIASCWLTGLPAVRAGDARTPGTIKVITYNVQFLPGLASLVNKRKDPVYRATTIGKQLAAYDIVGLNEVFEEKPRELLLGELRQAWRDEFNSVVSQRVDPKRFIGGLAIASRLPFLKTNQLNYTHGSSPKKYGIKADGFATKGALHARIALSRDPGEQRAIDVFVTHLESKDHDIRVTQYDELAQFVREHSAPDRPALMLGDFNTNGNADDLTNEQSAYRLMTNKFQAARPESQLVDVWPTLHQTPGGTGDQEAEDGGRRIDYIFVLEPRSTGFRLKPESVAVNRFLDPKVMSLSDHSAVEAILRPVSVTASAKR